MFLIVLDAVAALPAHALAALAPPFRYARHCFLLFCRGRIAMMASLIGPFGGFLASGIKRAYGVKDFGDT